MIEKLMSPRDMTEHNARILLKLIKMKNLLSRAEASRIMGCRRSTVSKLMDYLEKLSLIQPDGRKRGGRGKNSELYRYNPGANTALGVDIKPDALEFILSDLSGNTIDREELKNDRMDPQNTADLIHKTAEIMLTRHPSLQRGFIGAGVMVPGWVSDDGMVLNADPLGWVTPVHFRNLLNKKPPFPFWILNDANALVLAESAYGSIGGAGNLLYIENPDDIGGAFIDSRQNLLTGENSLALEIGKMQVHIEDRFWKAEKFLNIQRILKEWSVSKSDLKQVFDSPEGGNSRMCQQIADAFGQIIVQTSALLNPYAIMIHTPYISTLTALDYIKKATAGHLRETPLKEIQLLLPTLERSALGGACWAIHNSSFGFVIKD